MDTGISKIKLSKYAHLEAILIFRTINCREQDNVSIALSKEFSITEDETNSGLSNSHTWMVWDTQDKKEKSKTKTYLKTLMFSAENWNDRESKKSEEKFRVLNFPFEQK